MPHASFEPDGEGGHPMDGATLEFGVRKIEVSGRKILLNGKEVTFKGVNRHNEYPMKGIVVPKDIVRADLELMKRAGMNALRTAHMPDDPLVYDLADELGLLVIEEIPCTSLIEEEMETEKMQKVALDMARRMVQRDKNHPSIIIWSAGDEPEPLGFDSFNSLLYQAMKDIDPTRPVSYARVHTDISCQDPDSDLIMLNPYFGWYVGEVENLDRYLDMAADKFPDKPIILGEFGAGAYKDLRMLDAGDEAEHYTEDHQAWYLQATWEVVQRKDFMSGGLVWVFADFISPTREMLRSSEKGNYVEPNYIPYHNLKGLVDRDRVIKNGYLTVKGMFADEPLHHLMLSIKDDAGKPIKGAAIEIFDHDVLMGRQRSDTDGRAGLIYIPEADYRIEVSKGGDGSERQLRLKEDTDLEISL